MKQWKNIFLFISLISLIVSGCVLPEDKQDNPKAENENLAIRVDFLDTNTGRGGAQARSSLPEDVSRVVINITGVNIDKPIEFGLVKINGVWQGVIGNVPNGEA